MTGMVLFLMVFALLVLAARGLYLRERRKAARMQTDLIREGMAQAKTDLEIAKDYAKYLEQVTRRDEGIPPYGEKGGNKNV